MAGERELLLDFARFAGEADGEGRGHDAEYEDIVDRFLAQRGGALGYSDDELKGTARDERSELEQGT